MQSLRRLVNRLKQNGTEAEQLRNHMTESASDVSLTSRRNALRLLLFGAAGAVASTLSPLRAQAGRKQPGLTRVVMADEGLLKMAPKISIAYPYQLPPLPYDHDALQPVIRKRIMELHHGKHHNGYTKKLNAALADDPASQKKPLLVLLANLNLVPQKIRTAVRNNGGGYFNHALFWQMLKPGGGGAPGGELGAAIKREFGSFKNMQAEFSKAAKTVFGSGWAWLTVNNAGKLAIIQTANQDTPLALGHKPVLGIDVWEHAYYLQYENRRSEYIEKFWGLVNWKQCEMNYKA